MTVVESPNRDLQFETKSVMDFNKKNNNLNAFDRFLMKKKRFEELESEQESGGSSSAEEMESPKSVWKSYWRTTGKTKKKTSWSSPIVHHQVLKMREEDSYIGEEIRTTNNFHQLRSWHHHVDAILFSRRPSSPLSGNRSAIH